MTIVEFQSQAFLVIDAITDDLTHSPLTSVAQVPKHLADLKRIVRSAAEKLILCPDIESAVSLMKNEREAELAINGLVLHLIGSAEIEIALERAYKAAPSEMFPTYPAAALLIHLCDDLELAP